MIQTEHHETDSVGTSPFAPKSPNWELRATVFVWIVAFLSWCGALPVIVISLLVILAFLLKYLLGCHAAEPAAVTAVASLATW